MTLSTIGLERKTTERLADSLNELLADFQIYYQNLRGVHWNIKGQHFFELHVKFEELYNEAQENIDNVAERILTLGHTPLHTFEDYIKISKVKPGKDVSEARATVKLILNSLEELIKKEREILSISGDLEDEGTNAMMSDFISFQEKTVWMFKAFLG